jgi:hypothetical protein
LDASHWFDDLQVIGRQPAVQAAAKLREMGDMEAAAALDNRAGSAPQTFGLRGWLGGREPAWQHTAHAFGYIDQDSGTDDRSLPIRHAGQIAADDTLRNATIRITLDRLRAANYPGSGTHRILFDFYAQNQTRKDVEHLHFNTTFRVREGEEAAVIGYPIFVGLRVGPDGLAFKGFTVNVKNDDDEAMLSLMESDVMRSGLKLLSTAQPALAPLTGIAVALTTAVAKRNRNVPVQDFFMGLDFSTVPTRARLREGAYVAVQIPQRTALAWDWADWVYDVGNGHIVHRDDRQALVPYNYVVVGVTRQRE